ncbi:multiheme c-type cytochrome [Nitrospira sp. Kam-Ns4a]
MRRAHTILLIAVIVAGLVYLYYTEVKPVVIFGLRADYARAIPSQPIPAGLDSLRAEACGSCHREIYEEWKTSIHARAYTDPFFQAYWRKDRNIWVCLNCHAPLDSQQPTVVQEIPRGRVEKAAQVPNPHYDPDYQKEGISCAACHVRDGVILGPFDDSVAPHPTKFDPAFRTTQLCYRCHNVVSGPAQFYNVGPCGTYAEYEGKFFMQERGMICQSCHMPEVERPVAEGGPLRHGRQHLWRGGHDPEMIRRAVAVQVDAEPSVPIPGQPIRFTLTLINAGAGHKLPTGDPDRHFTVEFLVKDAKGRVIATQAETMGRWILWQPVILELYDNRLLPLASRAYTFDYTLPARPAGFTLTTRVRYHILTDSQHEMLVSRYGLTGNDPYTFTIYERAFPLSQDLAAALEAAQDPRTGCAAKSAGSHG